MILNILSLKLNNYGIKLYKASYKEKGSFDQWREEFQDYNFKRDGDSVYAWEIRNTSSKLDTAFSEAYIYIDDAGYVFSRVLEEAIKTYYTSQDPNTVCFYRKYTGLVAILFESKVKTWGKLQVCPKLEFKIVPEKMKGQTVFNMVVNIDAEVKLDISRKESEEGALGQIDWILDRNNEKVSSHFKNVEKYLGLINKTKEFEQFVSVYAPEGQHNLLGKFQQKFNTIIKDQLYLPDNLKVLGAELNVVNSGNYGSSNLGRPTRYFYNEATLEGKRYDEVLQQKRPYSYDVLKSKDIKVCAIVAKSNEGVYNRFEAALKEKMESVFHLNSINFEHDFLDSVELDKVQDHLNRKSLEGYDLVIIVLSERDKNERVNNSKYYNLKAKLLNQKIPTQFITAEKIQRTNPYYLNNISLNIYAKLGGTAWTIEKIDNEVKEFVIGIGSTVDELKHQIIGFASVFEHNGTYIVGNCNNAVGFDLYTDELYKQIKEIIETQINQYIGEVKLRLVFHLYKPASQRYEINAIEKALAEYKDSNITYAIVHISREHPFRIFTQGSRDYLNRGTYIQLNNYTSLLYLNKKSNSPLEIKLDKRSTYKDLFTLSQQIYFFSELSYKSFMPANIPVTLQYPSLMAKIMSNLNLIGKWDVGIVKQLENKLWFL